MGFKLLFVMKRFAPYLTTIFFVAVAIVFYQTLSQMDWQKVRLSLAQFSWPIVFPVICLVILDYLILSGYDYLGIRFFCIPGLSYFKILPSAFCSYAFNFNLGAWIGGLGFRFRIYSGWGVESASIPKIVIFSTLTNWLGHAFLSGIVFCLKPHAIEKLLGLSSGAAFAIGVAQLTLVFIYFTLCFFQKKITLRKVTYPLPKASWAFLQLALSSAQWSLVGGIIYLLLQHLGHNVEFGQILFTSLIASVAGVITHIPGGLGVLETVFLKVELGLPASDMLAALICYRVVYYFIPLLLAIPCYLGIEYYQKKHHKRFHAFNPPLY